MTNRRGFLGLLAHLPIVGAMFKGCGQEEPPVAGTFTAYYDPDIELDYRLDPDWSWIEWIPVKERIPDYLRRVLVCDCADGTVWESWLGYAAAYDGNEELIKENHVTHWAELPKAPLPPTDNATGITEYSDPSLVEDEYQDQLRLRIKLTDEEAAELRRRIEEYYRGPGPFPPAKIIPVT